MFQETAINIGYSCNLLTENLREVFIIDGETEREVEVQLKDVRRRIEQTLGTVNISFKLIAQLFLFDLSPSFFLSSYKRNGQVQMHVGFSFFYIFTAQKRKIKKKGNETRYDKLNPERKFSENIFKNDYYEKKNEITISRMKDHNC